MSESKKNISSILSKAFVLLLYVAFFGVQLFFNFDTGNNADSNAFYSYQGFAGNIYSHTIKQTNRTKNKKATVRLNKRFQPESIPAWNTILIKAPVCYIQTRIRNLPTDQHFSTSDLLTRSLRGPPVVA